MQNEIRKTETNQLPNQVAADQITISTPFNSELQSELTPDRIRQINRLCLQAEIDQSPGCNIPTDFDHIALMFQSSGMQEVLDVVVDFDSFKHYYDNIDSAFAALLEKTPDESANIFRTYKMLTTMFRIFNKHSEIIGNKLTDLYSLIKDVDILEQEMFDARKGGSNNA